MRFGFKLSMSRASDECRQLYLVLCVLERKDSGKDLAERIGRSDFDYYKERAVKVKEKTNGTVYYSEEDHSRVSIIWQDDKSRRFQWYGAHVEFEPNTLGFQIIRKLMKMNDGLGWRHMAAVDVVKFITDELKAIPLEHLTYNVEVEDSEFQASEFFPRQEAAAVAVA